MTPIRIQNRRQAAPGAIPDASEVVRTGSVAVVIPTYNHSRFLAESIGSVMQQTVRATEIVVVDDGSSDHPEDVVAQFPGVRFIRQENRGLAAARNTGLRAVRSDRVLFLDADDLLLPGAIETGLACFRSHPEAGFVYGAYRRIDPNGVPATAAIFTEIGADAFASFLKGNCIGMHATVLYDRERIIACGGFNEALPRCEDYDTYLRLSLRHPVACHPAVVADYRWHGGNMSADTGTMLKWALQVQGAFANIARGDPLRAQAFDEGRRFWRSHYSLQGLDRMRSQAGVGPKLAAAAAALRASPVCFVRTLVGMVRRKLVRLTRQRWFSGGGFGAFRFGDFAAIRPVCADFGFSRGLPIDRYYVEAFLARHSADIRGRALEVGDAAYCERFGRVSHQDVLHVNNGVPQATITGDLSRAGVLPRGVFDSMVITQTLHMIYDMPAAVRELYAGLKPGGILLLTCPGISRVDRADWKDTWYWSLTEASVRRMFSEVFGDDNCEFDIYGNVYSATCFLHGLGLGEVDEKKLDVLDAGFPVILTVRAHKPVQP